MGRFAILQIVPGREIFELNLDLGWAQLVAAAAHMHPLSELAGPTCEPTPLLTCACPDTTCRRSYTTAAARRHVECKRLGASIARTPPPLSSPALKGDLRCIFHPFLLLFPIGIR
jgi:hypothetical protein